MAAVRARVVPGSRTCHLRCSRSFQDAWPAATRETLDQALGQVRNHNLIGDGRGRRGDRPVRAGGRRHGRAHSRAASVILRSAACERSPLSTSSDVYRSATQQIVCCNQKLLLLTRSDPPSPGSNNESENATRRPVHGDGPGVRRWWR